MLDRISTRQCVDPRLRAVPFLDATAANTLEGFARKAAKRGVRVVLTGATQEVREELFVHGVQPPLVRYEAPSTGWRSPAARGRVLVAAAHARRADRGRRPSRSPASEATRRGSARTTRACGSTRSRPAPRCRPANRAGTNRARPGTPRSRRRASLPRTCRAARSSLRLAHVVVLGDREQEPRLHLRNQQVRAVRIRVTSPPPWNDAAAPTRSATAAAVRIMIGPPMQ